MREDDMMRGVIRVRIWESEEEGWMVMEMGSGNLFDRRRGKRVLKSICFPFRWNLNVILL